MARSARRRSSSRNTSRSDERRRNSTNGAAGEDAQGNQPSPSPITRPAAPTRRRSIFSRRFIPRAVGDIWSELRKVTWPTLDDVRYLTMVVAIVAVAVGAFLGVMDLFFGWVVEQVFFT